MERKRLYELDNIKILLMLLVIAHHACQAYSIGGSWIVKDTSNLQGLSSFLCVNMTFFMGAFFFISGYFLPQSLEKWRGEKGYQKYLYYRATKLLYPVLALLFLLVPISFYFVYRAQEVSPAGFFQYYISIYWGKGEFSYEQGWFLLSLYLYTALYILVTSRREAVQQNSHEKENLPYNKNKKANLFSKLTASRSSTLTGRKIILFILLMALLSGLIRLIYPIDEWVDILWIIGLEPAHVPQYLLLFFAGAAAYKNHWLEQISAKIGRSCIAISTTMIAIIYLQLLLPKQWMDAVYAVFFLYEAIMAVTILISLLYLFQKYFNHQGRIVKNISKHTMQIYIFHNLYVIGFQVLLLKADWNGYIKFAVVTVAAFCCAYLSSIVCSAFKRYLRGRLGRKKYDYVKDHKE